MRVPMRVFDVTPIGRMLNRFSKDLYTVDENLPSTLSSYISALFRVLEVVIVISYVANIFLAALVPIGIVYYITQKYYINTSREVQRLDSVLRSPIYSHFSESLDGTSSIRAFSAQGRFIEENHTRLDDNQQAYYANISLNRWLATRLELVGNVIVTMAALSAVMSRDSISSRYGALAISYALGVTQTLNWMVRMTSERETAVVSVERIEEYCQLEPEAPLESEPHLKPPVSWPSDGAIEFNNFQMRYRPDLDLVLRGLNCSIRPHEKVGIVGRTGAGKSSLMLALMRIVEGEYGGSIVIDGVDIRTIGLHDLRSKIAIIPQDPVLFTGSIRFNLDPFNRCPDHDLWRALDHSHLGDHIRSLSDGLDYVVAEGGSNFSVGQRQLLCLARALLRNSRVLLLDEATSGIDHQTDLLVQDTIRKQFTTCTVLTIAHRLDTVMESDRVMVMAAGRVVEIDTPATLLSQPESEFAQIVQAAKESNRLD